MANILLGVTGSVAAVKLPELVAALEAAGHHVRIVATEAALYFFDPQPYREREMLFRDSDEWPGERYRRGDGVLHVELRKWADALVIAPLDANTLAKLAAGLCDNCLTCVCRAWDRERPILIAPAMNTLMWDHPATRRHLKQLREDYPKLVECPPQEKLLACGDLGPGAMADVSEIAAAVASLVSPRAGLEIEPSTGPETRPRG